jgi:hypothetical protein
MCPSSEQPGKATVIVERLIGGRGKVGPYQLQPGAERLTVLL